MTGTVTQLRATPPTVSERLRDIATEIDGSNVVCAYVILIRDDGLQYGEYCGAPITRQFATGALLTEATRQAQMTIDGPT